MPYSTRHRIALQTLLLLILIGIGREAVAQDLAEILRQCAETFDQHPYVEWTLHVAVYRSASDPRPIDTSSYRYCIAKDRLAIHSNKLVVIRTPQYHLVVNHLLKTIEWTAAPDDAHLATQHAEIQQAIADMRTISYPQPDNTLDTAEVLTIIDSCDDQTVELYLFPRKSGVVRALYVVDGRRHVVQRAELYFHSLYQELTGERIVSIPERAFSVRPYIRPHRGSYTPTKAYANYQLIIH